MSKGDVSKHLKKTAKHSLIYGFGTMLGNLTGFFMLPIYTRYLTPHDYGVVALLNIAINIVSILVGMRVTQAMFRYYILAECEDDKNIVVSTVLLNVLAAGALGAVLIALLASQISLFLLGSDDYTRELRVLAFTLLSNAGLSLCLGYFRVRQKPWTFVILNVIYLILQVMANVVFIVLLDMHVLGVVAASLLSGLLMAVPMVIYVISKVGLHFSYTLLLRLFDFVRPLILASLLGLYVGQIDKYILRVFGDTSDVGIYALAAKLSSVLTTLYSAFNMSWGAERFEIYKNENAIEIYDIVFRFMAFVVISAAIVLGIFAEDVIRVMTSPEFYAASQVVPLLVLAAVFRVFTMFCNFGIFLHEKTVHVANSMWIQGVIVTVGCVLLVPGYGVIGVAIVAVISSFVELLWISSRSQRLYDMQLKWQSVLVMGMVGLLAVVASLYVSGSGLLVFMYKSSILLASLMLIYILPIWSPRDRLMMRYPLKWISLGVKRWRL